MLAFNPRACFLLTVTLTSDLEVWETASEGLSSSLLGTSPGASLAEAKNDEKHFHELTDDSDMGWRGDEGEWWLPLRTCDRRLDKMSLHLTLSYVCVYFACHIS